MHHSYHLLDVPPRDAGQDQRRGSESLLSLNLNKALHSCIKRIAWTLDLDGFPEVALSWIAKFASEEADGTKEMATSGFRRDSGGDFLEYKDE